MILVALKTLTWGTLATAVASAMLLAYVEACAPKLTRHASALNPTSTRTAATTARSAPHAHAASDASSVW